MNLFQYVKKRLSASSAGSTEPDWRLSLASSNPLFASGSDIVSESDDVIPFNAIKQRGRSPLIRARNDAAAKFRIRVNVRRDIFTKMEQVGAIAALGCTSLLVYGESPYEIRPLESYSYWKETMKNSAMYKALPSTHARGVLLRSERREYERLQAALCSLAQMICLATPDINDPELVRCYARLKLWAVTNGLAKSQQDHVIMALKWLGKACQAVFLRSEVPPQGERPIPIEDGVLLPFGGPLKFISDLILGARDRGYGLDLEEGRALAQLASLTRALPFPSKEQSKEAVEETVRTFSQERSISKSALRSHKTALLIWARSLRVTNRKTHMSLSNSGALESTRDSGGRAGHLVRLAKALDIKATPEVLSKLVNKHDCYGKVVLTPFAAKLAYLQSNEGIQVNLVHYLFTEDGDIIPQIDDVVNKELTVPKQLGLILSCVAAGELLKFGSYNEPSEVVLNLLVFENGGLKKFKLEKTIPVKASLSIEAGMKTRLVTAAPAGITQIGQLLGNFVRPIFAQDPFMRVGFNESEKLWEVLKAYERRYDKQSAKDRLVASISIH